VGGFAFGVLFALVMKWVGADGKLARASEDKAVLYTEHPLFLEGLAHLKSDNLVAAEAAFERLLAEKPDHVDASMELYRIKRDPAEAVKAASRAVVLSRRSNDFKTPLTIYTDMQQRHPDAPLDERGLFAVAECFERENDARTAASVYQRLVKLYPRSPIAPRAMLNLAQLYKDRLNDREQARQALISVMQTYADSPFADRAREILAQLT
jgi:tetratricopeptide (TPR) repeat protein